MEKWFSQIDAVARGVKARPESPTVHSRVVIQETVNIARRLQIPEEEIGRWATVRQMLDSQINAAIKPSHKVIGAKR